MASCAGVWLVFNAWTRNRVALNVNLNYLLLRLLLLGGCWWVLGDAQLGGHGSGVLAADGTAGRIGDALDLQGCRGNKGQRPQVVLRQ